MNQQYATARRNFTQPLPATPAPRQRLDGLGDLTTELDEFPVTLDLNEDAAPIFARESTIELAPEEISKALPVVAPLVAIDPFQPGQVIRDRYVIEAVIGQGGFAIVYRARDLRRDTAEGESAYVALKALRPELRTRPQAITRLKREFRQTHSLSHPNIVRVFDLDAHDDAWFIVMELLEGDTLAARLHQLEGRAMPFAQACTLLAACADALNFAHQHGIAHGDFKPTNLFVLNDGSMRLIDFGSSSELNLGASGDVPDQSDRVATPAYASPQVLAREIAEPRDDLFSFACVAFEMLAGTHPFARRASLTVQMSNCPVAESAPLSPHQMDVLKGGLAWRREDRPSSVNNFFHSLITPAPTQAEQEIQLDEIPVDSELMTPEAADSDFALGTATFSDSELPPALIPEQRVNAAMDIKLASLSISAAMAELSDSHTATQTQPSSQLVPTEAPLKATAKIAPQPAVQTISRNSQARAPSIAESMALLVAPSSTRFLPYSWLILFVLMYLVFLLLRSFSTQMDSSPQAQSIAPQTGLVHSGPVSPKTVPTPQESRNQLLLASPVPSANLVPVTKPTKPAANQLTSAVSFETSAMTVTKHAVSAAIILKRVNGHSGRLRVAWRVKAGSAAAGRDFGGPLSGVAEFADLQQMRTLFVPLINNPERSGDRTFAVELTNVSKDAQIRRVTVTIRDAG